MRVVETFVCDLVVLLEKAARKCSDGEAHVPSLSEWLESWVFLSAAF